MKEILLILIFVIVSSCGSGQSPPTIDFNDNTPPTYTPPTPIPPAEPWLEPWLKSYSFGETIRTLTYKRYRFEIEGTSIAFIYKDDELINSTASQPSLTDCLEWVDNELNWHYDNDLYFTRKGLTEGGIYTRVADRVPSNPYPSNLYSQWRTEFDYDKTRTWSSSISSYSSAIGGSIAIKTTSLSSNSFEGTVYVSNTQIGTTRSSNSMTGLVNALQNSLNPSAKANVNFNTSYSPYYLRYSFVITAYLKVSKVNLESLSLYAYVGGGWYYDSITWVGGSSAWFYEEDISYVRNIYETAGCSTSSWSVYCYNYTYKYYRVQAGWDSFNQTYYYENRPFFTVSTLPYFATYKLSDGSYNYKWSPPRAKSTAILYNSSND